MKRDEYKMTQQVDTTDYKQKYTEAIEKLKKAFTPVNGREIYWLSRSCIKQIFSELRESEDEQHRKWILEYLYDGLQKSDEQFKDQFNSAIAWLEKQGEQKPSWSEEDEKFYISALWHIKNSCGNGGKDSGEYEVYNWLKSIKPNHWKPSEEQMKALETTIHISNFGLDIDRLRMLESLYNDLKKL